VRLNDDDYVREQYGTTEKLDTRTSVWCADAPGNSPQDIALLALKDVNPRCILEVGSGRGTFAVRMAQEIECDVLALDSSVAMVSASTALGVESIVADVRDLPFPDQSFDAVFAAWMLYHVSPIAQGLKELARVLRLSGRLVTITNGRDHLKELWDAVGAEHDEPAFSVENGADHLGDYFSEVIRHDTNTHAIFPDRASAAAYLRSIDRTVLENHLPQTGWPLRARGSTAVFVADRPR
jgi:SAM-dependent methyltransferase